MLHDTDIIIHDCIKCTVQVSIDMDSNSPHLMEV